MSDTGDAAPPPSAEDVARWMVSEFEKTGFLDQAMAAYGIAQQFGDQFTYINANGNVAIAKPVLSAFRKLTETTAVWERGSRIWRKRTTYDQPSRRQY